ncbi:hypothetical protein [Yinghuangia soli]|uniref:Uncharacterized protein n=1 Tax=Yinghuangia soli TaxID=2908204 RepID=A0AA41U7I1_9ACTN|nr:hypothetical protein [Yinghuangia soli]MCF2534077.1 hypothetical protein [Yinghuangia soli]
MGDPLGAPPEELIRQEIAAIGLHQAIVLTQAAAGLLLAVVAAVTTRRHLRRLRAAPSDGEPTPLPE